MSLQGGGTIRSTPELFRDCLRLVNHVAGGRTSAKGTALRKIVANEFRKNSEVKDEQVIEALRGNAVRALSNYLMLQSLGKDDNLSKVAKTFKDQEAKQAKEIIDKEFENDAEVPPLSK
jgi:hypothetical protein